MTEFTPELKDVYEHVMSSAVSLHNQRRNEEALELRQYAYDIAPDGSSEKGRAARDINFSHDRLGHPDLAISYANQAFEIHDQRLNSVADPDRTRDLYRDRSVSAMAVGSLALRFAIKDNVECGELERDNRGFTTLDYLRMAWTDISLAKQKAPEGVNQEVDQYEINIARRLSMAESLYGKRLVGIATAIRAIRIARMSESPKLDTSETNFSKIQRMKAKAKAYAVGLIALGVGITATSQSGRLRSFSMKLAEKNP